MQLTIGITGGIATGKSTVTKLLQQQHYQIVDADQIAREVVLPQTKGWQQVVQTFGTQILHEDQSLDRKKLGQLVFDNSTQLQVLNEILQPIIRQRLIELIQAVPNNNVPVFFEIPLLFEQHYQNLLYKTILVTASSKVQLARLKARNNLSTHEAKQRIKSQMKLKQKKKLADFVLKNNRDYRYLQLQLQQVLTILLKEGEQS